MHVNENGDLTGVGLCRCGCGEKTRLAPKTDPRRDQVKGMPISYINGHNRKKGNGTALRRERKAIGHPRTKTGRIRVYVLMAENALGKFLPPKAQVHHHTRSQLVICEDSGYHKLLHARQRALEACGHADWRKCTVCKRYDSIKNLGGVHRRGPYHHKCKNDYQKELRRKRTLERLANRGTPV